MLELFIGIALLTSQLELLCTCHLKEDENCHQEFVYMNSVLTREVSLFKNYCFLLKVLLIHIQLVPN